MEVPYDAADLRPHRMEELGWGDGGWLDVYDEDDVGPVKNSQNSNR